MRVSTLATLVFLAFSAPASANDNETANRLFVEAVLKWKEATAIPDEGLNNAEVRVALLAAVANNLEQIIVAAPGSNLAVQLVLDEQIGPLSVAQVAEALASAQGILETEREREQCFSASSRQCVLILALQSAQTIEDAFPRGLALRNVAVAQAEAGMMTEALQTAQTIGSPVYRGLVLRDVAVAQAEAGMFTAALQTAQTIEDAFFVRWWALRDVAVAQAEAGMMTEALQTAQTIERADYRAWTIATLQAAAGMMTEALQTAQTIVSPVDRWFTLRDVAAAQAEAGMFTAALQTAQTIEDAYVRVRALTSVTHAGR